MCRKRKFDEMGAMLAVTQAKHSRNKTRREIRYYWCVVCNAFHLSSQPLNKKKQSDTLPAELPNNK